MILKPGPTTSVSDITGNAMPITLEDGTIHVTGLPEPSMLLHAGLAVLAALASGPWRARASRHRATPACPPL